MPEYCIVDWQQRYEVNSRGAAAGSNDKLQKHPLAYYRSKVTGTQQGKGYRKLLAIANSKALETFGIFHKLLEIAAGQDRASRGTINHSLSDLAFIIGVGEHQMSAALNVLCDPDIGWLEKVPEKTESSGSSREIAGKSGAFKNETKTKDNETKHIETGKDVFFDFSKCYLSPSVRLVAFHWFEVVKPLLKLKNKGDMACLRDIAQWLGDQVEAGRYKIRIFDNVWQWAMDGVNGQKPMAVFQARLKKELDYECKSKRAEK
ncbi:hypothetical protein LCGC14_0403230 [marine sediment metagenome]|uniref:Uncharacterized protein n=1 Tax=marine sediment metagenome TaxID=412755 RepID=A0A0F9VI10_9ZZZZ